MSIIAEVKNLFKKNESKKEETEKNYRRVNVTTMEKKYESGDYIGAAKDLKTLIQLYGIGKKKNHRYKGREFIYFILSNKHKDLKNKGYNHWKNLNGVITQVVPKKIYPYHISNLRNAMTFFENEIKSIKNFDIKI